MSTSIDVYIYQMLVKVAKMIRFRIKELLAEKEFRERRVISLTEVAAATGMNRMTLSRITNHPGTNTGTENVDRLCSYFKCNVGDLMEHISSNS